MSLLIYNSRNLIDVLDIYDYIDEPQIYNSRNLIDVLDFISDAFNVESTTVEIL